MSGRVTHRVEVFIGPFGSGKSEVAINRALSIAAAGRAATFIDLDLVDPFFRARQAREALQAAGITVVAPGRQWDEVDLPLFPPEVFAALGGPGSILIDAGGETQGAIVLRQILHLLPEDHAVYLVVNPYRPFMRTPAEIARTCRAIAEAAGAPVTALVANPHLAAETTVEVVRRGWEYVQAASTQLALPVAWTAVSAALLGQVALPGEIQPLDLHILPPWEQAVTARGPRPEPHRGGG